MFSIKGTEKGKKVTRAKFLGRLSVNLGFLTETGP